MMWFGDICFKEEYEEERGVYSTKETIEQFMGRVLQLSWKEQANNKINSDLRVSNKIVIVANPFLLNNFHNIAYITFGGAKWTIADVSVNAPEITLTLGSLYLEESGSEE